MKDKAPKLLADIVDSCTALVEWRSLRGAWRTCEGSWGCATGSSMATRPSTTMLCGPFWKPRYPGFWSKPGHFSPRQPLRPHEPVGPEAPPFAATGPGRSRRRAGGQAVGSIADGAALRSTVARDPQLGGCDARHAEVGGLLLDYPGVHRHHAGVSLQGQQLQIAHGISEVYATTQDACLRCLDLLCFARSFTPTRVERAALRLMDYGVQDVAALRFLLEHELDVLVLRADTEFDGQLGLGLTGAESSQRTWSPVFREKSCPFAVRRDTRWPAPLTGSSGCRIGAAMRPAPPPPPWGSSRRLAAAPERDLAASDALAPSSGVYGY